MESCPPEADPPSAESEGWGAFCFCHCEERSDEAIFSFILIPQNKRLDAICEDVVERVLEKND